MVLPQIPVYSFVPTPAQIWKNIPNYEGLYKVSNFGRFKALDKTYFTGENLLSKRFKKEHILKYGHHRDGYLQISLSNNGSKTFLAHILVATLFVPNPENKPEVNHLDGDKTNIASYNLGWVTRSENMQHAYSTGLKSSKKLGKSHKARKVLDTNTGIAYGSIKEAAIGIGMSYHNLLNRLLGVVDNKTGVIYA